MKTGAKIAIGCVVAVIGIGIIAVVGVVGVGYWAKQKVTSGLQQIQGNQAEINKYLAKAKLNPFTPPADGVITEAQLVKFLDIRKRVSPVYDKYAQQLEDLQKKKNQGGNPFQGFSTLMGALNEIRLAQAEAMADAGMSPREYGYLVGSVYKTYYANEFAKQNGGRQMSQVVGDYQKSLETMTPPPALPGEDPAATQARQRQWEQMQQQLRQSNMAGQARVADVPQANLDLFKKYETDIKKYLMPGMELVDAFGVGMAQ